MGLSRKQRQVVWDKSGGICWYCGNDLPDKGWHADHFEPIIRDSDIVKNPKTGLSEYRNNGKCLRPHLDTIENTVPACAKCNNLKSSFTIEWFRKELEDQVRRAREYSANFRTAERFSLVSINPDQRIVFWFERQLKSAPPS